MAREASEIKELPLNEVARVALRDSQEKKALEIENKRRKAKGEELLATLEEEPVDAEDPDLVIEEDEKSDEPDVLLTEAANVLVDVVLLKDRSFAARAPVDNPAK
jgi:carboxyl-terminal processing protease